MGCLPREDFGKALIGLFAFLKGLRRLGLMNFIFVVVIFFVLFRILKNLGNSFSLLNVFIFIVFFICFIRSFLVIFIFVIALLVLLPCATRLSLFCAIHRLVFFSFQNRCHV